MHSKSPCDRRRVRVALRRESTEALWIVILPTTPHRAKTIKSKAGDSGEWITRVFISACDRNGAYRHDVVAGIKCSKCDEQALVFEISQENEKREEVQDEGRARSLTVHISSCYQIDLWAGSS